MRNPAAIVVLVTALAASAWAGDPAAPDSPELVADRFARAWTSHDLDAFGQIFATDADWVTAAGVKVKGREAILAVLAREHATWARTTTMSVIARSVRWIGERDAVVYLEWEISGRVDDKGNPSGPSRGVNSLVVTRTASGWQIVAGQVTRTT